MKKQKIFSGALSMGLIALSIVGSANAALLSRLSGQAYYDDVANITWLTNANAGAGSTFDNGFSGTDGAMTWANANNWATSLNIGGVTGWRLPTTVQPDTTCSLHYSGFDGGNNCTGSEMGKLFYTALGNTAGFLTQTDSFINIQSVAGSFSSATSYWTATEYSISPSEAWIFSMHDGGQHVNFKTSEYFAWAVHSGDVVDAVSTVPVPAAIWLFASGLLGLSVMIRRKV